MFTVLSVHLQIYTVHTDSSECAIAAAADGDAVQVPHSLCACTTYLHIDLPHFRAGFSALVSRLMR